MGTRSHIGILNADGSAQSIYCHWDGYPSHHVPILTQSYVTEDHVRSLIALGDLSSLGRKLGTGHDFDERPSDTCNAYGRDRGEKGVDARRFASFSEFDRAADEEFAYLFVGWETEFPGHQRLVERAYLNSGGPVAGRSDTGVWLARRDGGPWVEARSLLDDTEPS